MLRCWSVVVLALPAFGQAVVESALGAGRAAGTAAPAQKIGNAVAGIAGTLRKTAGANTAAAPAAARTTTTSLSSASKDTESAKRARQYEEPKQIEKGMTYDEVMRRFGPPLMQITTGAASKSLAYPGVEAEVENGKVIAVTRAAGSEPTPAAK